MTMHNENLKGLILCGGRGARLQPLTHTIPKHLIPIANKPIIHYVIEQLIDAGTTNIGIVVSPDNGTSICQALGNGATWGVRFTYIMQEEPLGIAHAVKVARNFLGDTSFILFLGDNLLEGTIRRMLHVFRTKKPDACIMLKEVENPTQFGVAELDSNGNIIDIVEKPLETKSNLAIPGIYIFTPHIHDAIHQVKPSQRGELEITDSIRKMMEMRMSVRGYLHRGWWFDTGTKEDMLLANSTMLDALPMNSPCAIADDTSCISGKVEIMPGTTVINSHIIGPTAIGADCTIVDSNIGPYVSIGHRSIIENAHIENSIILEDRLIKNVRKINHSIIGKNSLVGELLRR
jgi:glucose-1-phosphate thymidylyltransferase